MHERQTATPAAGSADATANEAGHAADHPDRGAGERAVGDELT